MGEDIAGAAPPGARFLFEDFVESTVKHRPQTKLSFEQTNGP